jgi:hypothetical protein
MRPFCICMYFSPLHSANYTHIPDRPLFCILFSYPVSRLLYQCIFHLESSTVKSNSTSHHCNIFLQDTGRQLFYTFIVWRKFRYDETHNSQTWLYTLHSYITSRRIWCEAHVEGTKKIRNAYKNLIGKSEGTRPIGSPRCQCKNIVPPSPTNDDATSWCRFSVKITLLKLKHTANIVVFRKCKEHLNHN